MVGDSSVFFDPRSNMISLFQGNLNDLKRNLTGIAGRVSKLERRKKNASSPGSAAAKAGKAKMEKKSHTYWYKQNYCLILPRVKYSTILGVVPIIVNVTRSKGVDNDF